MAFEDITFGSDVSIISNSGIRYEGIFENFDETTLLLRNVKSFGTEGREGDKKVEASNKMYKFIRFKGEDISNICLAYKKEVEFVDPAILNAEVMDDSQSEECEEESSSNDINDDRQNSNRNEESKEISNSSKTSNGILKATLLSTGISSNIINETAIQSARNEVGGPHLKPKNGANETKSLVDTTKTKFFKPFEMNTPPIEHSFSSMKISDKTPQPNFTSSNTAKSKNSNTYNFRMNDTCPGGRSNKTQKSNFTSSNTAKSKNSNTYNFRMSDTCPDERSYKTQKYNFTSSNTSKSKKPNTFNFGMGGICPDERSNKTQQSVFTSSKSKPKNHNDFNFGMGGICPDERSSKTQQSIVTSSKSKPKPKNHNDFNFGMGGICPDERSSKTQQSIVTSSKSKPKNHNDFNFGMGDVCPDECSRFNYRNLRDLNTFKKIPTISKMEVKEFSFEKNDDIFNKTAERVETKVTETTFKKSYVNDYSPMNVSYNANNSFFDKLSYEEEHNDSNKHHSNIPYYSERQRNPRYSNRNPNYSYSNNHHGGNKPTTKIVVDKYYQMNKPTTQNNKKLPKSSSTQD